MIPLLLLLLESIITPLTNSHPYEFVGCFSHESQSLIETWSEEGLERSDCETFARRLDSPWFVLEYPQGYRRENDSIKRASCGVGGHVFMNDGQIEDESCLHEEEYYGSANKFALYSARSHFLKINITVDTVPRDFVVFRNESIDMAVQSFVRRFELEKETGAIEALKEMARMKLSNVTLLAPTQEELENSYITTKSEQVWKRLDGVSNVEVADDLLGEASMVSLSSLFLYLCENVTKTKISTASETRATRRNSSSRTDQGFG